MFENKKLIKYKMLTPVNVFKIETENDYDGFENYCAYGIQYNIFLPSSLKEKEYDGKRTNCEHEDDSYCMLKRKKCEHKRKIGYINLGAGKRLYPQIGQYVVTDGSKAFVVSEDSLNRNFILEE